MTPAPTSEACHACGRPHISALERLQIINRLQVANIAVESLVTKLSVSNWPKEARAGVGVKDDQIEEN